MVNQLRHKTQIRVAIAISLFLTENTETELATILENPALYLEQFTFYASKDTWFQARLRYLFAGQSSGRVYVTVNGSDPTHYIDFTRNLTNPRLYDPIRVGSAEARTMQGVLLDWPAHFTSVEVVKHTTAKREQVMRLYSRGQSLIGLKLQAPTDLLIRHYLTSAHQTLSLGRERTPKQVIDIYNAHKLGRLTFKLTDQTTWPYGIAFDNLRLASPIPKTWPSVLCDSNNIYNDRRPPSFFTLTLSIPNRDNYFIRPPGWQKVIEDITLPGIAYHIGIWSKSDNCAMYMANHHHTDTNTLEQFCVRRIKNRTRSRHILDRVGDKTFKANTPFAQYLQRLITDVPPMIQPMERLIVDNFLPRDDMTATEWFAYAGCPLTRDQLSMWSENR